MAATTESRYAAARRTREQARIHRAEERVEQELKAAARRERAAVGVPVRWLGVPRVGVIAWVVLAVCSAVGVLLFTEGRTAGVVAVTLAGLWVHAAGWWLAEPSGGRGAWFAVTSLAPAVILAVVVGRPLGIAVAVVAGAVGVVWQVRTWRARARLRPFAWAASQLAVATGDERELHRILTPARTVSGLPARWHVPATSTRRMVAAEEVEGEEAEDPSPWKSSSTFDPARVLSSALGVKVAVKVTGGIGVIATADQSKTAAERKRYDAVLAQHVSGRVTVLEHDEGGAFTRLQFTWPAKAAARVTSVPYQARVVKTLQSQLGVSLTARWDLKKSVATLTPLPPLATRLPRPPRDLENPMRIGFGQQRGGVECVFDMDGTLPHIAIGGGTGAGKTVLARTLLLGLPREPGKEVEVFPIDPKMIGFLGLDRIPGVHAPADNPEAIVEYLERVQQEMMRRYDALKTGAVKRNDLTPLVLLIDEGEEMADILNDWWASGEGKEDWARRRKMDKKPSGTTHPAMKLYLGSVLRLGRAARVHVIAASQQFSTAWMSTSSRSQFGIRIAVSNLEATTSEMLFGSRIATTGLDGTTPGRAWVSIGRGAVPVEAQIYWTPEIEDGLSGADREILHQLGVRLPDDDPELSIVGELAPSSFTDDEIHTPAPVLVLPPATSPSSDDADDSAQLLVEAAQLVLTSQYASTAMLTRKLRVAHATAVDLLDRLAGHDVVAATADDTFEVLLPVDALPALLERLDEPPATRTAPAAADDLVDEPEDAEEDLTGEQVPVLALEDGARILVDVDGALVPVTVTDVSPDDDEEDYLVVSYITDAEDSGAVSVPDDELVTVLAPA